MDKKNEYCVKVCVLLLQQFVTLNEADVAHEIKTVFEKNLPLSSDWFEKYFTEDKEKYAWV